MKTPYEFVGDTNSARAHLTTETGYDIARLTRLTPEVHPDLPPEHYPDDEVWQKTINLVNSAPALLAACRKIAMTFDPADLGALSPGQQGAVLAARRAFMAHEVAPETLTPFQEAVGPCPVCGKVEPWFNDVPLTAFCWGPDDAMHAEVRRVVPPPHNPYLGTGRLPAGLVGWRWAKNNRKVKI